MCEQKLFYNSVMRWLQRYADRFGNVVTIHESNNCFDFIECHLKDVEVAKQFYDGIQTQGDKPFNSADPDDLLSFEQDACQGINLYWCDNGMINNYSVDLMVVIA